MVWIGAAVAVAFVLLLVVRAMSNDEEPAPAPVPTKETVRGKPDRVSQPSVDGRSPVASAEEDEDAQGGTTVAPMKHAVSHASRPEPEQSESDLEIAVEEAQDEEPTGPVPLILVEAVGRTDPGRRRQHNEDAFLELPDKSLYVLADGMGGYAAGEVASQLAVEVIARAFKADSFDGDRDRGLPRRGDELVRAIRMANLAILEQARSNEAQAGMGTTIVAARFSPNKQRAYIAHVGDSRAYRLRKGELKQLTIDHTLGAAGIVGPSAAKLSRAVGIGEEVDVDLLTDSPLPGDCYMLCCDGLNKMVPDSVMRDIMLRDSDIAKAAGALIDAANERGGKDNITVILVRVDEPPGLRSKSPR